MSLRSVVTLAAPGVLILLPMGLLLRVTPDSPWLAEAVRGYPYAALAVAGILAWRFRRSRVIAAVIALAIVYVVMGPGLGSGWSVPVGLAAAVFAPLFAALALTADRRVGAPRAWLQVAAAPALALAGAAAVFFDGRIGDPDVSTLTLFLAQTPIEGLIAEWGWLLELPLVRAVPGLGALALLALYRRRALDGAFFWAALAGTLALAFPDPPALGAWILAGALALCFGVVEASHSMAFRDELTDLPGRRALNDLLASLRPPYTIAILDIDRFKSFNDRYGHDVGDQVLRKVAGHLRAVSGGGLAFRSGGEEFTIVFRGDGLKEARPHLEALRRGIADSQFTVRGPVRPAGTKGAKKRGRKRFGKGLARRRLSVTVSIGAAAFSRGSRTVEDVVKSADAAMYRAKRGGRNRVAV